MSRRKLPGLFPILLVLLLTMNILFMVYMKTTIKNLRKESSGHLEFHTWKSAEENVLLEHLEHIETMVRNISNTIKSSRNVEERKRADNIQLLEKSADEAQEAKEAKKEEGKHKAAPRMRFPDSHLFKRWGGDLAEDQQLEAQALFEQYGYNAYLSDQLPLDRSLEDTRPSRCLEKKYPHDLPTISVVLIFINEATSIILRAITTIINRTPSHLLKEIILVDDCSSHEELKGPLEKKIKRYDVKHPGLLKLVRHQKREGLTQARISGWKASSADVVAILDAHIEVNRGWAEPILSRIKEDRTIVISPVFDKVCFDNFELVRYTEAADGFDWALWCLYESIPTDWYGLGDETAPIRSPSVMGIFAANREFLGAIGVLDGGMHIYGGENVELGIRTWQCGGKIEVLPCSRVAHIERTHKPYLMDLTIAMKRNALRVAEVWMDEYKNMVYYAWNIPLENHGVDFGDVSSRKELRKKLNCKSFDWYIKNVYPNLVPQTAIVAYGTMKNALKKDICIDQGPMPGNTPIMYGCHGYNSQYIFYHSTGEIYVGNLRSQRSMVDRCLVDTSQGELPFLEQCNEALKKGLNMHWDFRQGAAVINRKTKRCLEIVKDQGASVYRLVLQNCTGQKWTIQHTVKDWGSKGTAG
ncbi:probable polypeptide N-acetylgalactosaminyltransferase 8 [Heteronotia binoei]|uniref:probable polypeptide N-acetylgalactosaminyltransferase 8 n=1 Tax=Heteronotia binoei TaxID=13085 RepID=UPI002930006B|nr:probable polypeptide N-acetylgalactosaminyltransferase 8 [Heteronotia binoei]